MGAVGISLTSDGEVVVQGSDARLIYSSRLVRLSDGTTVAHESQGGEMASVWASDLGGDWFVEVAHLGDGPVGGELVMTVTHASTRHVAIGDLWAADLPDVVPASWPVAVDLALGLLGPDTVVIQPVITKDDLEDLHQRLLGVLHG